MFKTNFSKSNFYKLIVIFSVTSILPILFLIYKFNNQIISNDISDWSDFGSFLSGTTNTLTSIFSLIILAYLTYFVGQQSSQENKNVNILMRKLDAFDALASHMPRFNIFAHEFSRNAQIVVKELRSENRSQEFYNRINTLVEKVSYVNELNYFLYSFQHRYGHLFDYNFQSQDHKSLIQVSEKVSKYYQEFAQNLELEEKILSSLNIEDHEELAIRIGNLMSNLRNELK